MTWWARLLERRRSTHADPFSRAEFVLLAEANTEASAVRRRRRRSRKALLRAAAAEAAARADWFGLVNDGVPARRRSPDVGVVRPRPDSTPRIVTDLL